jgi:hypothetical protein
MLFQSAEVIRNSGDKNNQAGHIHFMIIGAQCTEVPCQVQLLEIESGSAEVDHALPCPIRTHTYEVASEFGLSRQHDPGLRTRALP